MAGISYQDGSTLRTVSSIRYQDGSTLRDVQSVYYQDGSTLRLVWQKTTPLSASASPPSLTKLGPAGTVTTGTTTVTATGGSGTKTYSWARLSGDTQILCNSPSSSTTAFHATVSSSDSFSAVWRCTVTDSSGSTTVDVTVNIASNA